jgi:hypothetical protein
VKAISLWQPWATLVACGAKRIETRSWPTPYRGPLAIHAAKRWTIDEQVLLSDPHFRAALAVALQEKVWQGPNLPLGSVVALATLRDCLPTTPANLARLGIAEDPWEAEFGNYAPGRFMWVLEDVLSVVPIPARGAQGLWDWERPDAIESTPLRIPHKSALKREACLRMLRAKRDGQEGLTLHLDTCPRRQGADRVECVCGVTVMSDFLRWLQAKNQEWQAEAEAAAETARASRPARPPTKARAGRPRTDAPTLPGF